MSWAIQAIGKPRAVAKACRDQAFAHECAEPEESIKAAVIRNIDLALAAYPDTMAVTVAASGSQSATADGRAANSLQLSIEPVWGFLDDAPA